MTDMFAPGATLRAAREKRNLSQADIAEATRIKVHIIDAIENNDFQRLTAPLYVKGFIRMYAERVGLDPEPLIREYLVRYAQQVRPTLNADLPQSAGPDLPREPVARNRPRRQAAPVRTVDAAGAMLAAGRAVALRMAGDLAGATRTAVLAVRSAWGQRGRTAPWERRRDLGMTRPYRGSSDFPVGRYAAIGTAIAVVAILAGFAIHLFQSSSRPAPVATVRAAAAAVTKAEPAAPPRLRLAEEPPAPYLKPRKP